MVTIMSVIRWILICEKGHRDSGQLHRESRYLMKNIGNAYVNSDGWCYYFDRGNLGWLRPFQFEIREQ